jgi:hypothetical protein
MVNLVTSNFKILHHFFRQSLNVARRLLCLMTPNRWSVGSKVDAFGRIDVACGQPCGRVPSENNA